MWERLLAAIKMVFALLIAAKSRSHNQKTIVSGSKEKTDGIKPVLCFVTSEISGRHRKLLLILSFRIPHSAFRIPHSDFRIQIIPNPWPRPVL
jgi:hypothetical protein